MNCVFTGRQFQAFLLDPSFWGQGQSYENLRLLVNGVPCGQQEFASDWDPQDLDPETYVQVLDGVWHGHGFRLPNHQMSHVIEYWLAGQKPEKIAKPVPIPQPSITRVAIKAETHSAVADREELATSRPMFKI